MGFRVDPIIGSVPGTYRTFILVKKEGALTFSEKWVIPTLLKTKGMNTTSNNIEMATQNISFPVLASKAGEFTQGLLTVMPQMDDREYSERISKNDSRGCLVMLGYFILVTIIVFLFVYFRFL